MLIEKEILVEDENELRISEDVKELLVVDVEVEKVMDHILIKHYKEKMK